MSTVQKTSKYAWELNGNGEVVFTGLVDNKNATEVVVPAEIDGRPVVAIGTGAFCEQRTLRRVVISRGVKKICESAFESCDALETVVLPSGLNVIEDYAFAWCESLKKLELPADVDKIGARAFWGCGPWKRSTLRKVRAKLAKALFPVVSR